MEKSGFFNAMKVGNTWDRVYKAETYAEYFASFIGNGVFPNPSTNLQVIGTDKMQVIVKPGKGWINGYKYENTDDLILPIDVADGVLHRIDKIVLRYDVVEREIRAKIKKGEFASEPKAPQLTRDADMYELGLADIKVNAGSISITQVDITDLRLSKEFCGIVHGIVDQVDTTTIFNQYLEWYKNITGKTEQDLQDIKGNLETNFKIWFDGIKEILSGDVAGNLLNLINKNKESIDTIENNVDEKIETVKSDLADIATDNKRLTNAKDITGAINELFTNANNGKKLISDVVGKPLLATDTFQQQNDKIQSLKNALVSNLNVKRQVSSNAESLKSLIDKVLNINTGRKSASGKQDQKNLINGIILEVSDLDFKPSIIFLYVSCHTSYYIAYSNSSVSYRYCHSDEVYPYHSTNFPLSIKPDGFRYEHLNTNFWDISWLAIE
ncbi:hypothetical protein [Clostridium botulinum]|uniref:hypothetical protein n=1 Tax=Clostridium botulinum TaxID=1491 RepID=UPI001C9AB427|nr:hypothetical protein [Clostridium botulinum]MBY6950354.1 hypothetical protein [Clostridium botulinum]MCR1138604.1 hypothetical protein [Clostridium botulinum]